MKKNVYHHSNPVQIDLSNPVEMKSLVAVVVFFKLFLLAFINPWNLLSGHLLLQLARLDLLELLDASIGLGAQDTATGVLSHLVVTLVEVGLADLDNLAQRSLVLSVDGCQSHAGECLAANNLSQAGLTLDNAVWDAHLFAQSWQVDDNLNSKTTKLVFNFHRDYRRNELMSTSIGSTSWAMTTS